MLRIDRILFPTDGSACAAQAHEHAIDMADRHQATLHILHVEEDSSVEPDRVAEIYEGDVLTDLHDDSSSEASGAASPRVEQYTVQHPSARRAILMYAAEHDVDLIVMGTHGRRGIVRAVMGSVAEAVVRRSECPVLTIRARDDAMPVPYFDRLLVPIDFSPHMPALLRHAGALATMYDVPIHLLHVTEQIVLPTAYGIQPPTMDSEALREAAREAIAPHASDLEAQGRTVHVHLREGHPAQEILATAEGSSGAPLIALSTHGRTGLKRLLLGSVAEKVIRRAPCPVFVVKAFGRSLVSDADAATASSASPED